MRKLTVYGVLILLLIGCKKNNFIGNNYENTQKESVHKNSNNLDERYIGGWKLVETNVTNKGNDNSMEEIICEMEKYLNSDESYVFHLFTGHELILTKETNNHLVGQNANMNADYNENNRELTISIPGGSSWIFKKIK